MGKSNQLEEMAIKQALEYKAFYEEHGRKPSKILNCKTKEQKEYAMYKQTYEQKLAVWFGNTKIRKRNNKIYPSVDNIIIDLLGKAWYDNRNLEEIAIKKALDYKMFYEEHQRKPSFVLKGKSKEQKESATEEQTYECRLAEWFQGIKKSKNGKGHYKLYPSIERILIDTFGLEWFA
jgi:hypothetical protein